MLFRHSHGRSVKRTGASVWTSLLFAGLYVACYLLRDDFAPALESQDDIFRELA